MPFEVKTQTLPNGYRVTYRNDCELEVIYDDIFGKNVYYFEANTSEPIHRRLRRHIGLAVLYFKSLYPEARILSFEPNPETFALLEANIAQNGLRGVQAMNMALTHDGRKDAFSTSERIFFRPGIRRTRSSPIFGSTCTSIAGIRFDRPELSSYINKRVDFVKLDIEGRRSPSWTN